jgi:hypothetical protein
MEKQTILERTRFRNQPPSAAGIVFIILLAAAGLLGALFYLTHDVRTGSYRQEHWAIRDSAAVDGKNALIDTMYVTINSNIQLQKIPAKSIQADVNWDYKDLFMTYNPTFLVWMSLIALMTALSFALFPVIIKGIADIYKMTGLVGRHLFYAISITLIIGGCITLTNQVPYVLMLFDLMEKAKVLLYHPGRLNAFIIICLIPGLTAITGQLLINYAVSKLPENIFEVEAAEQKRVVANFLLLRNRLKFFLTADAALIVLSILTTDTLKSAIMTALSLSKSAKHVLFPQEFVYLYGLVFTLYLAILYIPVYYRLKYKGETMVESLNPDNADQVKLAANFIIQESALDSFKVALSILAPIVSSLLPGLIKF